MILDSLTEFAERMGVTLYPWQSVAFSGATERVDGRFRWRLAGVSVPRGNGKSYAGAVVGLWRLLCGPAPQDVLSAALDYDGAKVLLDHARAIIRGNPAMSRAVEVRANGFVVPSTGSRWTITSREHTAARGRHPDVVLYDEVGWARDDELFASLLAGQASVADPSMLVVSTVGRREVGPLWRVKQLAEAGDAYFYHSAENLSPRVTADFLERQRRILSPSQYAREHENTWTSGSDAFTSAAAVDHAMGQGWTVQAAGRPGVAYHAYVDLGAVHDFTVIAVGHHEAGLDHVDVIKTFAGSHESPVDLAAVEGAIRDLADVFDIALIRVESWQGLGTVQRLGRLGLPVQLFTPTAKTNAAEWPVLGQRLASRTLVLPPHERLREELLGLYEEPGPAGVRVVDKGRAHQDHAVAVRGVVASLAASQQLGRIFSPADFSGVLVRA